MNKNDLIEALAPRLGDRARAALAVEALVDAVLREVAAGGTVGITGFGTFEPVDRAPRTGRNPHTGAAVPIPATRTPRFRPGSYFKAVVADPARLPEEGLAGARVGSADEEAPGTTPSRAHLTGGTSAESRSGAPATVRRAADVARPAGKERTGQAGEGKKARARRRTGAPATVRADRPEPAPAPQAESRRQSRTSRRMTIGGEQITHDMITAKKAQLARAKDDEVAGKDGAGPKAGKDTEEKTAKKARKSKDEADKKAKDKGKGKGKKGKGKKGGRTS